jgi:hypothetical protein
LLKLSQAIAGWAPSDRGSLRDPLTLLQAGWPEIVGAEVAASCAPSRIAGDTLTIVTRSAAWSHQLSFLAEHVRGAVAARLPEAGIERLRFRIGAFPKRGRPVPQAPASSAITRPPASPPSATAAESLARFASHVQEAQRAKRSAGWKECTACGALIVPSPASYCSACGAARFEERVLATARLLFEAPWLGYAGTAELVDGLSEKEYERIRTQLLKRWWGMLERTKAAGRLSRDGRERLVANAYVVLSSKLSPESIMPATVRNVLGDELHDLLYSDERRA